MMYQSTGRGGLYPDGCAFESYTANGAIERYYAVRVACGRAVVRDRLGTELSLAGLSALAEQELTEQA
jgi:hypothetical protein